MKAKLVAAQPKGFTLIELLVVLVLLGLISSIAVVSVGVNNQSRELENEVRRMHALMRLAAEEAILQNQEYGFYIDNEGYDFLIYDDADNSWTASQGESLRSRELPEWLTIELTRDNEAKSLAVKDDDKEKKPLLLFLSSGESTPHTLRFFIDNQESRAFYIESDGFSDIVLRTPKESSED